MFTEKNINILMGILNYSVNKIIFNVFGKIPYNAKESQKTNLNMLILRQDGYAKNFNASKNSF